MLIEPTSDERYQTSGADSEDEDHGSINHVMPDPSVFILRHAIVLISSYVLFSSLSLSEKHSSRSLSIIQDIGNAVLIDTRTSA